MDNNSVFSIFIGIIIVSVSVGFEFTMIRGFQVLGGGIIILGLFDGILTYLDGDN